MYNITYVKVLLFTGRERGERDGGELNSELSRLLCSCMLPLHKSCLTVMCSPINFSNAC